MIALSAEDVKAAIVSCLERPLRTARIPEGQVPDDFDIIAEGVIDSLGFIQLIGELERRFGVALAFDGLDPDELTVIGPLSRYIAETALVEQDK